MLSREQRSDGCSIGFAGTSQGDRGHHEEALGEGMVLVPPGDPAELATTIRDLLADGEALRALSAAARRTADARLSWDRCGAATMAIYEAALER